MQPIQDYMLDIEDYLLNEEIENQEIQQKQLIVMTCLNMFFLQTLIQNQKIDFDLFKSIVKQTMNHFKNINEIKISAVMAYINNKTKQLAPTM